MKHYFLDTNIALDLLLERQPFAQPVAQLIEQSTQQQVRLSISSLSFTTIYYIMCRQRITDALVLAALQKLALVTFIAPVTSPIIHQALQANLPDFEDAVQLFTALSIGADSLITRDQAGFPAGYLPVMDTVVALVQLQT